MTTQVAAGIFIKQHFYGILSTHSLSHPGFPFGSVVPYIISAEGNIAIYLSDLAEHTKNIQANPKISLTITQERDEFNQMDGARITCLATARISTNQASLKEKYCQQFVQANLVTSLPGFIFYELDLEAVRLIAGFGKIMWLHPEQLDLR